MSIRRKQYIGVASSPSLVEHRRKEAERSAAEITGRNPDFAKRYEEWAKRKDIEGRRLAAGAVFATIVAGAVLAGAEADQNRQAQSDLERRLPRDDVRRVRNKLK